MRQDPGDRVRSARKAVIFNMIVRKYRSEDLSEILKLFYDTVHSVCKADYTLAQLDAWAPAAPDTERWRASLEKHYALVALADGAIAGFGDIDETGYLDRLYVHKDRIRRGVGGALLTKLENAFPVTEITTHASITAKPFFEAKGYVAIREQQVERRGVTMTNFVMKKSLEPLIY